MDDRLIGGRYRLLESIGVGGMASVWRAVDERTGDVVVVKRLHPHLVVDPSARARLSREADSMRAIRHPNVVRVRDAVIDGAEPALIMDHVPGRSVADMLTDGHRFTEPETLAVATAVADGLAAVHRAGIVHRDIKPSNLLIGEDGIARIFDFGIAAGAADASALTADDGVVGTMRYLPPERLRGDVAGPAADIWGLGAVAYEMLAGGPAFSAMTVRDRVATADDLPVRPSDVGDATWAILARALAPSPADRFADGAAMAFALRGRPAVPTAGGGGLVPDATPEMVAPYEGTGLPGRTRGPVRDRRPWVAGGLVALLLAAGLAASAARPEIAATIETPPPSAGPTRAPTAVPADERSRAEPGRGKGKHKGNGKGKDKR